MANIPLSRVGTYNAFDSTVRNLSSRNGTLSSLQEHLSAGTRVLRPSDDPTAAAQAERARTRLSRVETDQRALENQRNTIALAEANLGDSADMLQSIRQLMVQAGNGALSATDRKSITQQIQGLSEQLLAQANAQDGNGLSLFSGWGNSDPLVAPNASTSPTTYTFNGLPGEIPSSASSITPALDGDKTWNFHATRDGVFDASMTLVPRSATETKPTTSAVSVSDNAAVTGNSYQIGFGAGGGSYTVTDPSTGITGNHVSGQAMAFDGLLFARDDTAPSKYTVTDQKTGATVFDSSNITNPLDPLYYSGPGAPLVFNGRTISFSNADADYTASKTYVPGQAVEFDGLKLSINGAAKEGDKIDIKPAPDVFSILDRAMERLNQAADSGDVSQAVGQALAQIDSALKNIMASRGQAGELLNRADRITGLNETRALQAEGDRSRAEDMDMIKGISEFQNQQTGYSAALQTYAQIQKLSLFNYIS